MVYKRMQSALRVLELYLVLGMQEALELARPGLPALRGIGHLVQCGRPLLQQLAPHQRLQLGHAPLTRGIVVLPAEMEGKVQPLLVFFDQRLHSHDRSIVQYLSQICPAQDNDNCFGTCILPISEQ